MGFLGGCLVLLLFAIPYINHIIWCVEAAAHTGSAIALLIIGIVFFPIGWLHGVSLFLGFTWI